MSQAGRYVVTALYWEQITSKPGQPFDFVRHPRGAVVDLDAEEARRLLAAGAVVPESAAAEGDPGTDPGEGSTSGEDLIDGKIPEILAEVGDDPEKARVVLEAELARGDAARSTLVSKIEAVIAAADGDQGQS